MTQFVGEPVFLRDLAFGDLHSFKVTGGAQYTLAITTSRPQVVQSYPDLVPVLASPDNLDSKNLVIQTSELTGSVMNIGFADKTLASAGGGTGPFQFVWIYNSDTGAIIGYIDEGAPVSLVDGQNWVVDFTDANNYLCSLSFI